VTDDGSLNGLIDEILFLWKEHCIMAAGEELEKLDARLYLHGDGGGDEDAADIARAKKRLEALEKTRIAPLRIRYPQCRAAFSQFNSNEGWKLGNVMFGTSTYFKHHDTCLVVKVDGIMGTCDLASCLCIWKEVQLYNKWFPSCTNSAKIATLSDVELVAYLKIGIFPIVRDATIHGYGCVCPPTPAADENSKPSGGWPWRAQLHFFVSDLLSFQASS
jgi:hypothetical protein